MSKRKKKSGNINTEVKESIKFISWIQEYSKRIVSITFLIFFAANVFTLIMLTLQFMNDRNMTYLDTYIMEVHSTFREVIGGYLLKAATENVFKIGGGLLESYARTKATIIENKMNEEDNISEPMVDEFADIPKEIPTDEEETFEAVEEYPSVELTDHVNMKGRETVDLLSL